MLNLGTLRLAIVTALIVTCPAHGFHTPDDVLSTLRPHPRLLFTAEDEARVRALAERDVLLDRLIALNLERAERQLEAPTAEEKLVGPRLLAQSRHALDVIQCCALAFRLTGDRRFADRAVREMVNAARFESWNPSHFLDVAEMTTGLAVGYDWLFEAMSEEERTGIRAAIVEKGLGPGLAAYEANAWWTRGSNNWDQVCNAGLTLGALAIADEEPEIARTILENAIRCIPRIDHVYEPDGGYPEGPGYWGYGTTYHVVMSNALLTALGDRRGVATSDGLKRTALFPIACLGPTGRLFNFADGRDRFSGTPALFELARIAGRDDVAAWYATFLASQRRARSRFSALDIAWYLAPTAGGEAAYAEWPLDMRFGGRQPCAMLRGSWTDPETTWLAIKGGDNQAPHGHLDLGSFVLEASGVRWAIDLGGDDYNLPGYWDEQEDGRRWSYFRLSTESHSTLLIDGRRQHAEAKAGITDFVSAPQRAAVTLDLTAAYPDRAQRTVRTAELLDRRDVRLTDRIEGPSGPVRWAMVTDAPTITLDGPHAILEKNGRRLAARITAPPGATWRLEDPPPPSHEREHPNEGVRLLTTTVAPAEGDDAIEIIVELQPADS